MSELSDEQIQAFYRDHGLELDPHAHTLTVHDIYGAWSVARAIHAAGFAEGSAQGIDAGLAEGRRLEREATLRWLPTNMRDSFALFIARAAQPDTKES